MIKRTLFTLFGILCLAGCSSLNPQFEEPTVTIKAFRMDYPRATTPAFVIDLHVVNPNRVPLRLNGLSYKASIEGHPLLAGVSKELPEIEAYGEGDITVTASPDLLGGLRLIKDLMQSQRSSLNYELAIKLDVKGWLTPIRIKETGAIGTASRS